MSYPEYEAHIRSRRDYARIARKDGSGERQVMGHSWCQPMGRTMGRGGCEGDPGVGFVGLRGVKEPLALPSGLQVAFVQKRFHKDIFPNPVLMLNFCPAVEPAPGDLQSVTREVLFLVDRSGTMSSPDVDKVKVRRGSRGWGLSLSGRPSAALPVPSPPPQEALLVALKSLPSGTLLNIAGFGSDVQPLFPSSRLCSNVSAAGGCTAPAPSILPTPTPSPWLLSVPRAVHLSVHACRRLCAVPAGTWASCGWPRVAPTSWRP